MLGLARSISTSYPTCGKHPGHGGQVHGQLWLGAGLGLRAWPRALCPGLEDLNLRRRLECRGPSRPGSCATEGSRRSACFPPQSLN